MYRLKFGSPLAFLAVCGVAAWLGPACSGDKSDTDTGAGGDADTDTDTDTDVDTDTDTDTDVTNTCPGLGNALVCQGLITASSLSFGTTGTGTTGTGTTGTGTTGTTGTGTGTTGTGTTGTGTTGTGTTGTPTTTGGTGAPPVQCPEVALDFSTTGRVRVTVFDQSCTRNDVELTWTCKDNQVDIGGISTGTWDNTTGTLVTSEWGTLTVAECPI